MATTDILLTSAIKGLGSEGDTVKVKAGYARNFLLPRGLAVSLNKANQRYITALFKKRQEREAAELQNAKALAKQLESIHIAVPVKTGKGGKLFGAVTTIEILKRLEDAGLVIDKKRASMQPAKTLGKHTLHIKLHSDVVVDFDFEVVSENPIEEDY